MDGTGESRVTLDWTKTQIFTVDFEGLLGAHRNVGLSMGAGATRLIGGDIEGRPSVLPNIRLLNVGIAF